MTAEVKNWSFRDRLRTISVLVHRMVNLGSYFRSSDRWSAHPSDVPVWAFSPACFPGRSLPGRDDGLAQGGGA